MGIPNKLVWGKCYPDFFLGPKKMTSCARSSQHNPSHNFDSFSSCDLCSSALRIPAGWRCGLPRQECEKPGHWLRLVRGIVAIHAQMCNPSGMVGQRPCDHMTPARIQLGFRQPRWHGRKRSKRNVHSTAAGARIGSSLACDSRSTDPGLSKRSRRQSAQACIGQPASCFRTALAS